MRRQIKLDQLAVTRKRGGKLVHMQGHAQGLALRGFWQRACSELSSTTLRGMLARDLVACNPGIADGTRTEWAPYDLRARQGISVEVKSAA